MRRLLPPVLRCAFSDHVPDAGCALSGPSKCSLPLYLGPSPLTDHRSGSLRSRPSFCFCPHLRMSPPIESSPPFQRTGAIVYRTPPLPSLFGAYTPGDELGSFQPSIRSSQWRYPRFYCPSVVVGFTRSVLKLSLCSFYGSRDPIEHKPRGSSDTVPV